MIFGCRKGTSTIVSKGTFHVNAVAVPIIDPAEIAACNVEPVH